MSTKSIFVRVLLIAAIPFVIFGLIDPLEGGLALVFAAAIYLLAFLLKKSWPGKMLWIPFLIAVVLGAATLTFAILNLSFTPGPSELRLELRIGVWLYRAAVIATLVGGVQAVIQEFRKPS